MEKVDLKWEKNEVEVEEEEEGGLQVRSSKGTKEVTNVKIETNGHANSFHKISNGTEKSDLVDEQERSEGHLLDSNNGVEVEEGTDPKEVSVQKIVASNNGVEVEEETEPIEESVQKIVASNDGVEEEAEPIEESVHKIVASNNGVVEGTEPVEESVQQIVASNGVEKGTEVKEASKQHFVTYSDGVEEGTESKEESKQQIVLSNNGVEEGAEPEKESKQHLVTSTDGVEEGTEAEERPFRSGHSVYNEKDEDSNYTSTPSIKEKIDKNPGDEGVQESATLGIQLNGYLKSDSFSSSNAQPSKDLSEYHRIVRKSTTIDEIKSADTDLINDSDTDVKDFDVENVLQKQNTHDLYCPNCKSCITRRVILCKRKRKIRVSGDDVKRNKLEVIVDSKVDASHAKTADNEVRDGVDSSPDGTPPLAADDYQPDREPEIFRCLSCLSLFIPTGNGFKLFRIFGEKGDKENVKGEQTPTTNKNWFSSIFALDKGKASVEQGSGIGANAVENDSGVLMPSDNFKDQSAKSLVIKESAPLAYSSSEITQKAGGKILGSKNQDANMKGKMVINTVGGSVLDIFELETSNQSEASASSKEVQGNDRNDELLRTTGRIQVSNGNLVQDSVPASQQNELKLLITSTKEESLTIEKSETDLRCDVAILNKGPDNESLLSLAATASALNGLDGNGKPNFLTEIPQEHEQHIEAMLPSESLVENNDNKCQLSSKDGVHHYEVSQHTITKTNIEIHSKQPLKVDQGALISSVKDAFSIQDKPDNITNISVEAAANSIAGNDTIITVEAGHETTETASANLDTQIHFVEGQGTDAAEVYKIEIIKSIIFGGLAESITSLSIVSSATGGDTSTLNILVLGMANLIGGLFIIFHNLWELKRDRFEQASNQIIEKHIDRYQEQLGRRENFTMHAVLVVLSYIIFGLVPPMIYGFSFRKSDDKELKIVAVAAASLVCILMLATGKAYVQRAHKPYFKTISAYIILGFTVSGVSYAAGILFKRLLEKLGLFQPSSTANLLLPEMPGTGAAWAFL